MQMTCPCCHAHIAIEAALNDEAGRELMGVLTNLPTELVRPLVHYLGFFRPAKQQLGWGRALRLVREVLALNSQTQALELALNEAARGLDEKRCQGGWKPLGNHNYLRRCMESAGPRLEATLAATSGMAFPQHSAAPKLQSKAAAGLMALEGMRR